MDANLALGLPDENRNYQATPTLTQAVTRPDPNPNPTRRAFFPYFLYTYCTAYETLVT